MREMRSRTSSKHSNRSMEEKRPKLKEEPHLSGAYIRSLVKQLSSSRPKEPMNPKSPDKPVGSDGSPQHLCNQIAEGFGSDTQQQQVPRPQPKKQVRRRLHTSRPYQERLLNMAEARREIVTALKFHRAAMKQANEQQQKQLLQAADSPPSPPPLEGSHREVEYRKTPRTNPVNAASSSTFLTYFNNPSFPSFSYPTPFSWSYSSISSLPISDNLNFTLPNQPLGLNLSFHDFGNIDSTPYYNNNQNAPPIIQASTTSSPSSSSSPTNISGAEAPSVLTGPSQASEATSEPADGMLHPAMDDEAMAEIQSIGEQHEMEWNDKLNLVTSAWWCNFFKNMETGPQGQDEGIGGGEDDGLHLFNEAMEIPAWLTDQQHLDDYYPDNYLQDAALPCLDIGEMEGMDVEWLSWGD